jgi:hypothetical protein
LKYNLAEMSADFLRTLRNSAGEFSVIFSPADLADFVQIAFSIHYYPCTTIHLT